jgi:hypothetical protein
MRTIALTGTNEPAMARVAELLLDASRAGGFALRVHVGVDDAHQATTVTAHEPSSEIWQVGMAMSSPELEPLIDRMISDAGKFATAESTARALRLFMSKHAGAGV